MSSAPPPAPVGLLVLAMASPGYLAASNVIPSDDADFGAPRWVVAWLVAGTFGWVGFWLLSLGGPILRLLGAVFPSAVAIHACHHGLTRTGFVQAAWLALGLFMALIALGHWRRFVRLIRSLA